MAALISKPGVTSASTLSIPTDWDKTWFRGFIQNQLKGADVRNAIGVNGISITGNISSPYATIGLGPPALIGSVSFTGTLGSPTLQLNSVNGYQLVLNSTSGTYSGLYFNHIGVNGASIVFDNTNSRLLIVGATVANEIVMNYTVPWTISSAHGISFLAPGTDGTTVTITGQSGVAGFALSVVTGNVGIGMRLTGRGAGVAAIQADTTCNTGGAAGTLIANKPGGPANTVTWLPIIYDGTNTGYIPIFG
jgi:hypothetical protein